LAALAGGAAPGLYSQEDSGPYKFDLKIRLGFYGGDLQQAKFDNKIIGFGLQARRELFGPGRAVAAEVTWEHIPSRWNDVTDYAKHNQYNTNAEWESSGLLSLHPYWSGDGRKEAARGLSLLLSYHSKIPTGFGLDALSGLGEMEWYAGLRLDNYSVHSEFRWWLRNQSNQAEILPWPATPPALQPPNYENGQGAFREEGSAFAPGAFAGLRYSINESFALEVDLRYFGNKHWDFTPGAYIKTDAGGHSAVGRLETGTSYGPAIGFALVCKL